MSVRAEHLAVTKSARLYLIGDGAELKDLWIVCHGYGQLAGRFARSFEKIAAPGRLIAAPEGLHRFYLDPPPAPAAQRRVGATWMTREDRETDIRDNICYLDRVVDHLLASRNRAGVRIRALGFSQGCATVFRWAALGNVAIDELILWAGEVPPDVDMKTAAARLRETSLLIVHGTNDELASPAIIGRQYALLDAGGLTYETRDFQGGHELDDDLLSVIASRV